MNNSLNVWLTEDDPDEQEIFTLFLADRTDVRLDGFFDSGVSLLRHLEESGNDAVTANLILLDQNMPIMTGYQILVKLKADPRFSMIPVVIFSTYADAYLEEDCLEAGALAVFNKPLTAAGYHLMIEQIFKKIDSRHGTRENH